MSRDDPILFECNVVLDTDPKLMVFRFPSNLKRKEISSVETKPNNLKFELEIDSGAKSVKRKYKSRRLVNSASVVGAQFQWDGLHLTAIQSCHEFKYCLSHLNTASKEKPGNDDVSPIETPEQVKVSAVTMRFAAVNEEERRRIREGTFNHHREVLGKEKSIQLDYQLLPDEEVRVKMESMET